MDGVGREGGTSRSEQRSTSQILAGYLIACLRDARGRIRATIYLLLACTALDAATESASMTHFPSFHAFFWSSFECTSGLSDRI